MNNSATFVLSTGRCGTQWLAAAVGKVYSDKVAVEHEPLDARYNAREALAANTSSELTFDPPPEVKTHVAWIEQQLQTRPYIEFGHPNWSVIPWLARQFQGRVRVMHLTRHPVPCSYSWVSHGAFQEQLLPHEQPKIPLLPFDEGAEFKEYQDRWDVLSPFEKSLYYWSEVNAFALKLEARVDAPWLRLSYEDLFGSNGLERLLSFVELPMRSEIVEMRGEFVDKYHYLIRSLDDWRCIEAHPRVIEVATALGYDLECLDEVAMRQRYLGTA